MYGAVGFIAKLASLQISKSGANHFWLVEVR